MNLPPEEEERLAIFSDYVHKDDLTGALAFARKAIEESTSHKGLWHGQTGALIFEVEQDELLAFHHYEQSLALGDDPVICEENMWEAAEVFFLSLKTKEGEFNAIAQRQEEKKGQRLFKTFRANHLLEKFVVLFPEGQFTAQAKDYLTEFEAATED
ncbi:MAG: hypothetical protein ACRBFS_13300 [Aureispira sp.]